MAARARRDARAFDRELVAAAAGQLVVLSAISATVGLGALGWLAGTVYAVVLGILLARSAPGERAAATGSANRITLLRATLVGGVTALVADGVVPGALDGPRITVLVATASVALVLDLLDGYVARRSGTVSALGARFDMEVDALLVLVLSVLVAPSIGAWVLAIGLMRYAFLLVEWRVPRLRAALPPSRARKVVAAVQGVVLVAAAAPVVPRAPATAALALALAALVWSFGRDTLWLVRRPRT